MKLCLWCEKEIDPSTRSKYQNKIIVTHPGSCQRYYSWHRCSASEIAKDEPKYCLECGKLLVMRDNEQHQAFVKRENCNKSCSSKLRNNFFKNKKYEQPLTDIPEGIKVKVYTPGTPEFDEIAALYNRF